MSSSLNPMEKSSVAGDDCGAKAESSRSPYEAMDLQPDTPVKRPAVDLSRNSLWMPLYVVSFIAIVAAFVLVGVSCAVDMFYVEVASSRYTTDTDFSAVCSGGCAGADNLSVDSLLRPSDPDVDSRTLSDVYAQMQPFALASCTEQDVGAYAISFGSTKTKARIDFQVVCSNIFATARYTDFKYVVGFTFFHAVGAPRIHRMSYPVSNQTVPVVAIMFASNGLALVLYAAVVALRATLSSPASASNTRERCCACNAPNHVRRLTAAAISFVVVSVAMTIIQLILCGHGWMVTSTCDGCGKKVEVTGGYWAIFAIMLVLQVIALALICACYAVRA